MATPRTRLVFVRAAAVGGLVLIGAACANSDPAGDVADGPAAGGAIPIGIGDDRFVPARVEVGERGVLTFEVTNGDGDRHDFAVRAQGLNTGTLESGDVATARIRIGDAPVTFVCTFHDDMRGEIVFVEPAGDVPGG